MVKTARTHAPERNPALADNRVLRVRQLPQVLVALGVTQARRYSIATSPLAQPGHVGVCVGAVLPNEAKHDYEGLCSGFLRRSDVGKTVWLKTRQAQASFHLPKDPKTPVLMIGAGTGIAPFLAFMVRRKSEWLGRRMAHIARRSTAQRRG